MITDAPPLPKRPAPEVNETQPQADDLEDVKKVCSGISFPTSVLISSQLCAMGFSRSLAIEALDANDYDFQKALNALLVK